MKKSLIIGLLLTGAMGFAAEKLTLSKALETALKNNLDIKVQKTSLEDNIYALEIQFGEFGTSLSSSLFLQDSERTIVNSRSTEGSKSENLSFSTKIERPFQFGGKLTFDFNTGKQKVNNEGATFNPSYNANYKLTFSQELWRNFGKEKTEINIRVAEENVNSNRQSLVIKINDILVQTEKSYWDVLLAEETYKVRQQALELARQQYEDLKRSVEIGTKAPVDLPQEEANVAQAELSLVRSQNDIDNAWLTLKALLHQEDADYVTVMPNINTSSVEGSIQSWRLKSKSNRPEWKQMIADENKVNWQMIQQKELLKPQLGFQAIYGKANAGGVNIANDINDSWVDVASDPKDPTWSVALNLSIPLERRKVNAQVARARLALDRLQLDKEKLSQTIRQEVDLAYRNLSASIKSYTAAQKTEKARETAYNAQREKYKNGLTTNFVVDEARKDWEQSKLDALTEVSNILKYRADLDKASGVYFQQRGINIS